MLKTDVLELEQGGFVLLLQVDQSAVWQVGDILPTFPAALQLSLAFADFAARCPVPVTADIVRGVWDDFERGGCQ